MLGIVIRDVRDFEDISKKNVSVNVINRSILEGDVLDKLKEIDDNSIDLIATDPPYGYSMMNKNWDKAVISVDIWKECLRVLKHGAFAYIMSAPRQDVLSHMIVNLSDAGFKTDFTSIYWAYGVGFPKAMNIQKAIRKRYETSKSRMQDLWKISLHQTEILPKNQEYDWRIMSEMLEDLEHKKQYEIFAYSRSQIENLQISQRQKEYFLERGHNIQESQGELYRCQICSMSTGVFVNGKKRWICNGTQISNGKISWEIINEEGSSSSFESQTTGQQNTKFEVICQQCTTQKMGTLKGSYAGFQPKPAVEVILVCMKPLSEKNYTEQAMKNGKGITWLDDCRIPFQGDNDCKPYASRLNFNKNLNDDNWNKIGIHEPKTTNQKGRFPANLLVSNDALNDGKTHKTGGTANKQYNVSGSTFSDAATVTQTVSDEGSFSRYFDLDAWEAQFIITPKPSKSEKNKGLDNFTEAQVNDGRNIPPDNTFQRGTTQRKNTHPTVKPVSLFKYLITMGSREGDLILDPFMGSGTTAIACEQIARKWIGIEKNPEYVDIFKARLADYINQNKMEEFL